MRCVLFDLGDTLWSRGDITSWERLEACANQRAVVLLRERVASQLPANLDDLALGKRLRESFSQYVGALIRRDPEIEPEGPVVAMETLRQWGIEGIDIRFGAAIFEALRVRVPESRPLFKDTLSTLAALQQRGLLLGVVTNRIWGGQPFQEDLQTLGLHKYFDLRTIAVSADLKVRKPNPAIFFHALNALNVAPEDAVMVGDSLRADIVGAQRLGICAAWKPKAKARKYLNARLLARGASGGVVQSGEMFAPLPGMRVTDDDYVLARAPSRDYYLEQFLSGEIRPDLIIEHSRDLLDILSEVGVQ